MSTFWNTVQRHRNRSAVHDSPPPQQQQHVPTNVSSSPSSLPSSRWTVTWLPHYYKQSYKKRTTSQKVISIMCLVRKLPRRIKLSLIALLMLWLCWTILIKSFRQHRRPLTEDEKLHQEMLAFLQQHHPTTTSPRLAHLMSTWQAPLVHIVNTRFMQEQGHLLALGHARLHLFRTFCLPTMIQQSTQNFLWIIKTDPMLDPTIRDQLIQDLMPHDNIYLVASNNNFMIRRDPQPSPIGAAAAAAAAATGEGNSWRDGAEPRDLLAPTTHIYTGNQTRLYQAMLQKNLQIVLETRLDADDGLHKYFLQNIQEKALEQFLPYHLQPQNHHRHRPIQFDRPIPRWLYWCTRRHVEWHGGIRPALQLPHVSNNNGTLLAAAAGSTSSSSSEHDYYGTLQVVQHSKMCITPGITVGFGIGTKSDNVPIHPHDKLFDAIHGLHQDQGCGYHQVSDCLELVEDFLLVAVRARTPTSAGMLNVDTNNNNNKDDSNDSNDHHTHNNNRTKTKQKKRRYHQKVEVSNMRNYLYWDLLHHDFAVLREQIKFTNQFILHHLVAIAKDNLKGQCTTDHSCKVRRFATQAIFVSSCWACPCNLTNQLFHTLAGRHKGQADEDYPRTQLINK